MYVRPGPGLACLQYARQGDIYYPLPAVMKPNITALQRMPANATALAKCQRFAQAVEHAIKVYNRPGTEVRALLNINRGILRLTNELRNQRGAAPLREKVLEDWSSIWDKPFF